LYTVWIGLAKTLAEPSAAGQARIKKTSEAALIATQLVFLMPKTG
jgi:hypothetical protein